MQDRENKLTDLMTQVIKEIKIVEEKNQNLLRLVGKMKIQEADLFNQIEKLRIELHGLKVTEKEKAKRKEAIENNKAKEVDYQDIMKDYLAAKARKAYSNVG